MMLSIREVAEKFGVCIITIRRWEKSGRLSPAIRTFGGHRRYDSDVIEEILTNKPKVDDKLTVCYTRVSSHDQKEDLERQKDKLINYATENNYMNVKSIDLGSGLNYKKKDC